MKKHPWLGFVLLACVLGSLGVVRWQLIAKTYASSPPPVRVVQNEAGPLADTGRSLVGVSYGALSPTDATPAFNADQALISARTLWGPAIDSATSITAFYTLFTDSEFADRGGDGLYHPRFVNVPAWVITLDGLNLPAAGGSAPVLASGTTSTSTVPSIHHELHIIINARTGAYMLSYAYS